MALLAILAVVSSLLPGILVQSSVTNTFIPVVASSSSLTPPTPTASALPPIDPIAQTFLKELGTASIYAFLIGAGDGTARTAEAICEAIKPDQIDKIGPGSFDGAAIQREACAAATLESDTPNVTGPLIASNRAGVGYLATAVLGVELAAGVGGAPDLKKICSEIEAELIDRLFINYTNTTVGTQVRDYICNAANAALSSSSSTSDSAANNTTTTTTTTPTIPSCTSPQGFQNTVVPVSCALQSASFQVSEAFEAKHDLFNITDTNILLPEADFAKFCLDQCVSSKAKTCLSFFVNWGKPYPPAPAGQSQASRWYCKGYDAPLSATDFTPVNAPGSYLNGLAVNRVCGGTYRAY